MKVYDIKKEYTELQELMEKDEYVYDSETGELLEDNSQLLKELSENLQSSKEEKLDNIEYIKKELKIAQQALKDEGKRLSERAKMMENNQKRLLDLQDYLLAGEKIKTDKFTFFYGSSQSLIIEDESEVPERFISFIPKIDKTALKTAIKNGDVIADEFDFIKLQTKISLRVK